MDTVTARLEAALIRELSRTAARLSTDRFRGQLRPCAIALSDDAKLGSWHRGTRTISISRKLAFSSPWSVVVEVLLHELAHMYVDEVLKVADETAHGPAFRRVCRDFGVDAAAAGLPEAAPPSEEDKVLRRIQRLLALADSPNQHEAEAAMSAAQRLMLKHNIAWAASATEGRYTFRVLGEAKARHDAHEKLLASILAGHFFVTAVWVPAWLPLEARYGRVLEVSGTPENLDIAEYVHRYLLETAERLWHDHKRAQRISSDKERRRYLAGVMHGFWGKLQRGKEEARQEGLVWVGDPKLSAYAEIRYPHTRSSRTTVVASEAWDAGRQAGQGIVLRKPVTERPTERGRRIAGPVGGRSD